MGFFLKKRNTHDNKVHYFGNLVKLKFMLESFIPVFMAW